MQQLHLVGLTTELDSLIFSTRKGTKSGGFTVRLDDRFVEIIAEAVRRREEEAAAGASAHRNRPESSLSPREIQARLRSGQPREEIAEEAGVDEAWVARFEAPVLAERAQVVARTHQLVYAKPRLGESSQPVGLAVRWNLADKGIRMHADEFDRHWSAYQLPDGRWVVSFEFVSRKKAQSAVWEVDLRERSVLARNRLASELAYVEPGRRRRTYVEPDSLSASPHGRPARSDAATDAEVELPLVDVSRGAGNGGSRRGAPATSAKTTKAARTTKAGKAAKKSASAAKKTTASRATASRARSSRAAPSARTAKAAGSAGRARAPAAEPAPEPPRPPAQERPPLVAARRAPAPPPPDPNMDELSRRRLELARARPGPLPGSGPRRAAELRRLVVPPPEVVPPMRTSDGPTPAGEDDASPTEGLDVPMEDLVARRRAERAAERRARAAARSGQAGEFGEEEADDVDEAPRALGPGPAEPERQPVSDPAPEARVVRIRADRVDGGSSGGAGDGFDRSGAGGAGSGPWDEVRPARRGPLRPALPAAQPRKRRFGRAR